MKPLLTLLTAILIISCNSKKTFKYAIATPEDIRQIYECDSLTKLNKPPGTYIVNGDTIIIIKNDRR